MKDMLSHSHTVLYFPRNMYTRKGFVDALLELVPDKNAADSDRLVNNNQDSDRDQNHFHVVPKTQ